MYSKRELQRGGISHSAIAYSGPLQLKHSLLHVCAGEGDASNLNIDDAARKTYLRILALSNYLLIPLSIEGPHPFQSLQQVIPTTATFSEIWDSMIKEQRDESTVPQDDLLHWLSLANLLFCVRQSESGDVFVHVQRMQPACVTVRCYGPLPVELAPVVVNKLNAEPENVVAEVIQRIRQAQASLITIELCVQEGIRLSQTFSSAVEYAVVRAFVNDFRSLV